MRQVQAFRETNHEYLTQVINEWLVENNVIAFSIAVTFDPGGYFHAFVVYGNNSDSGRVSL
jgi:hypothetical protein